MAPRKEAAALRRGGARQHASRVNSRVVAAVWGCESAMPSTVAGAATAGAAMAAAAMAAAVMAAAVMAAAAALQRGIAALTLQVAVIWDNHARLALRTAQHHTVRIESYRAAQCACLLPVTRLPCTALPPKSPAHMKLPKHPS